MHKVSVQKFFSFPFSKWITVLYLHLWWSCWLITMLYNTPTDPQKGQGYVLGMIYTKPGGQGGREYSSDLLVRELTDKPMWLHGSGTAWSGIPHLLGSSAGNHCPSGNLSVYKSARDVNVPTDWLQRDYLAATWQCSHVSLVAQAIKGWYMHCWLAQYVWVMIQIRQFQRSVVFKTDGKLECQCYLLFSDFGDSYRIYQACELVSN